MGKGIGGHTKAFKGETNIWLTPPHIIPALGHFDLDPCAAPSPRPWGTAERYIELPEDGLMAEWKGRVWLNPPYGDETGPWLERLADHGHGTALVFARTETANWFDHIWHKADAVFFLHGRLTFFHPDGTMGGSNAGGPSALVAYGEQDAIILKVCALPGKFISLRER